MKVTCVTCLYDALCLLVFNDCNFPFNLKITKIPSKLFSKRIPVTSIKYKQHKKSHDTLFVACSKKGGTCDRSFCGSAEALVWRILVFNEAAAAFWTRVFVIWGVSENRGGAPQIIHFYWDFHYKPSTFGVSLFLEAPI